MFFLLQIVVSTFWLCNNVLILVFRWNSVLFTLWSGLWILKFLLYEYFDWI